MQKHHSITVSSSPAGQSGNLLMVPPEGALRGPVAIRLPRLGVAVSSQRSCRNARRLRLAVLVGLEREQLAERSPREERLLYCAVLERHGEAVAFLARERADAAPCVVDDDFDRGHCGTSKKRNGELE